MRWELVDHTGRTWRAVRAVDTATHPDFQRRGIFSQLTRHAVEEVRAQGVDIVFNTPNTQSRPGYLKMGWIDVGHLPVAFRPTSLTAMTRLVRARTAAAKWSEPSAVGFPATELLSTSSLDDLIASQPASPGLATVWSPELLRWRYQLEPLHYRAWAPDGIKDGVVLFRERKRGAALECSIGHVLAPSGDMHRQRDLLRSLSRVVNADYMLRLGGSDFRSRFMALPNQGPQLTARAVNREPAPSVSDWSFQLGDIELF
jgi:hypothetical protein